MAPLTQGFSSLIKPARRNPDRAMTTSRKFTWKLLWVSLLMLAPAAFAQFTAGVQGSVQDSTGASIPNATITLTNVDDQVTRTTTSDASGVFRFASLGPGNYTVSASASGFSTTKTQIELSAGENRNVPLTLSVGQVATNVTVTTQSPLLDTSD